MPTAGAIVPPQITPLRKPVPGQPSTHINTATYIELDTETPGCKIYFSTDGTKPTPFQLKKAGRETTFKYRGPFTLKPGKRALKVVAVSRDEQHESNVVTKTFVVEDVGPPSDDIDSLFNGGIEEEENGGLVPARSLKRPYSAANKRKKPLRNSVNLSRVSLPTAPKNAWDEMTPSADTNVLVNSFFDPVTNQQITNSSVTVPDGPFNPTNYSGTQLNFWGVAPPGGVPIPTGNGFSAPYGNSAQIGPMTSNMLASLEKPTVSVADLKRWMDYTMQQGRQQVQAPPPAPPQPAIQYPKEPELKAESPANGDWKGQLEHIYAHLVDHCKRDMTFRSSVGQPKLGKILHADFDEEDTAFLLTVSIAKSGVAQPVKTMKKASAAKTMASKQHEKPKPREPPKEKPKPKPKAEPREESYFETEEYEQEGTLKAWPAFDAERDCEKLKSAMKGMGTDEKALVDVLGYRSCSQRQEVVIMFKTMFGKDLSKELEGENSGNFKELLKALCLSPPAYDASEVNRAIKGLGTDEDALIEILCTRTNAQIKAMKAAYKKKYGKEMEKDVKGDTSGFFKRLLVAQINASRDESPTFDRTAAKRDAKALFEAGEKKWGTDESVFNAILCQRSFPHLRAVFEEYKSFSKKDIEDVIKSEFSGDIKNGLLTVVRCIRYKPDYFARKLQKAMKGLGTDDQAMVRIAVTRCESDMVQIKNSFQQQFKKSLAEWIKDDTSGDYCEMLLALIGEREIPAPSAEEIEEAQEEQEMEEVEEEKIQEEGTLKAADPFDAKRDCEVLKKAMKGFGTDEDAIINVLTKRSNEQRLEIVNMYKTMFGKDLKKELKSEISSHFCDAILGLCQSSAEFDANELRKAMKGLGTDEACLIEIICTRSSTQMKDIVKMYQQLHNRKLEEDIISETSGHLKRLLVSMVQANRPEGNMVNRTKARKDAKALYGAGADKFGTDESRFNVIICSRSYPQLRATFEEYQKAYNTDIEKVISSEMSGDLKEGMLTVVRCLRNKAGQFAKRLYDSMQGLGTDDDTLVRVVVSRCEVDMVQIKEVFQKTYNQSLGAYIADDIGGDYKKTILNLVGEERYIKK